jgi:hypothetical protein
MSNKVDSYCKEIEKNNIEGFIIPSKDNKWFFTFLVTLLNEKSFKLLDSKTPKTELKDFYDSIKSPKKPIFGDLTKEVNDFTFNMKRQMDISNELYNYLIKNNLYNYFLLPKYLKYLGFSCITFECFKTDLYGGIYNYLKLYNEKDGKPVCAIDIKNMKKSKGLKYDQRYDFNPDYLLINMWNNDDKFLDSIIGDDELKYYDLDTNDIIEENKVPYNKVDYNGYEYKLKSVLLTNYNIKEYKKPEHTISITECHNKNYAFTNSFYKIKPATKKPKDFIMSFNPLQKYEEKPCTTLVELTNKNKNKRMLLSEYYCELKSNGDEKIKEIDETTNYCFSIKKGKRVLIYIKGNRIKTEEEIARERAEAAEIKKKMEEAKKAAEEEAKTAKNKKKEETPEEKQERLEKEKLCNTINDYLKKIKTNQDKDKIFDKIKAEKDFIANQLKTLEAKEKTYETNKSELQRLRADIDKMQKENVRAMSDIMKNFKEEFNQPRPQPQKSSQKAHTAQSAQSPKEV